jgi:hypothetical protein
MKTEVEYYFYGSPKELYSRGALVWILNMRQKAYRKCGDSRL